MTQQEYNSNVRSWADKAFAFAVRCCDDRSVDQDAVQESLAALWTKRDKVPVEKGRSFLFTLTYRYIMNHFRRRSILDRSEADMAALAPRAAPPDESFDLKEAVQKALSQLPETQRAILQLRDIEGYSYKEISNILNISDQRVQVYLFRARVALKKKLIDFQ